MKKKLLFSLLLGSAFAWMNEMYAADTTAKKDETASSKEAEKPASIEKAAVKYEVETTEGKKITISVHQKRNDIVYKNLVVLDGAYANFNTQKTRKVQGLDVPFIPGQKLPEGYKVVNIFFPLDADGKAEKGKYVDLYGGSGKNCDADFSKCKIQTINIENPAVPTGFGSPDEFTWMLMKEDTSEIFIADMYLEPNNDAFFGNQKNDGGLELAKANKARSFYIPDPAEVKNAKISIEELTALKAKGGGASSEELEKLKKELEEEKKKPGNGSIDSQKASDLQKRIQELQAGLASAVNDLKGLNVTGEAHDNSNAILAEFFEFKGVKFSVTSSDAEAIKNPEQFKELVTNVEKLFSGYPHVVAAVLSEMVKSSADSKVLGKISVADIYKITGVDGKINDVKIIADLSAATGESFEKLKSLEDALLKEFGTVSNPSNVDNGGVVNADSVDAGHVVSPVSDVVDANGVPHVEKVETLTNENSQLANELDNKDAELASQKAELEAAKEALAKSIEVIDKEKANDSQLIQEKLQAEQEKVLVIDQANAIIAQEKAKSDQEKALLADQANKLIADINNKATNALNQSESEKQAAKDEAKKLAEEKDALKDASVQSKIDLATVTAKHEEVTKQLNEVKAGKQNAEVKPAEEPKVESPKVEVKPAEEQKVETPKVEVKPAEEPKVEAPKVEVKPAEEPKVEAPKVEVKPAEEHKVEAPKVEVKPAEAA